MDDAQLLLRYVKEGSEAAFSELVGRHLNLVHSAALRQVGGDFHRARDVTQMVFTLLARKAPSLTHHTALTGWLYSTTHFVASPLMRSERRRKIREEETHHMNELLANPEPEVDWNRLRAVLDGAMFELNEPDREAVLWRYFDALPLAVLGQRLGVSENAAKKRVERALDKMRAALAKRGATSTTAALAMMLTSHAVIAAPAGLLETVAATALGAGAQTSRLLRFLGKVKLASGVAGVMWVGGILAISALGTGAYELWMAGRANAALAQENDGYAAQQERFRALQQRVAHEARPEAAAAASAEPTAPDPKADFQKFLVAYPQARQLVLTLEESAVDESYDSFFKSAGLTPAQIAQFEKVIAENWMRSMTLVRGLPAEAETPMPPADQLRAILGDQAYQQFQDYKRTSYGNYWAYKAAAASADAPFSTAQSDQLAQLLANNSGVTPPGHVGPPVDSVDWNAILAQARPLLSDSQWKSAETALRDLQLRRDLNRAGESPSALENNLGPSP